MSIQVLSDDDVRALPARDAVAAVRAALLASHRGTLASPPRVRAQLGDLDYVFTVGAMQGSVSGFRAYRAGAPAGDQLVAVWDNDGSLAGVIVGDELGARRTGALGGAAADALARPESTDVAVIGSGQQAWTQLWALAAVRAISTVRVWSPDPQHRAGFADRAARQLGVEALASEASQRALEGADIVILATRATSPVIDAQDVSPGAHVVTVGPKTADRHEAPPALADIASVVTCDSPAQAASYGDRFFTDRPLTHLGAVLAGDAPGRVADDDITLHCSVGLAGSEVVLAQRILGLPSR